MSFPKTVSKQHFPVRPDTQDFVEQNPCGPKAKMGRYGNFPGKIDIGNGKET